MRMTEKNIRDFDIDQIFECGQCFRWDLENDGSYTGVAGKRFANITFAKGTLIIKGVDEGSEDFWRRYLDLERDYREIKEYLSSQDEIICEAISLGHGIRLLQQEPWETLISFIISQNNNIPRIKGCIQSLCENFGEKLCTYNGLDYYAFPEPKIIAGLSVEELSVCRLGYRAKYLIDTAKKVVLEGPEKLVEMCDPSVSYDEAFSYVCNFPGVGPKVANCILLFSMGKYDSFPVDVWMKRVMKELYGLTNEKAIADFARQKYGQYGGIAQQYLFYYVRSKTC